MGILVQRAARRASPVLAQAGLAMLQSGMLVRVPGSAMAGTAQEFSVYCPGCPVWPVVARTATASSTPGAAVAAAGVGEGGGHTHPPPSAPPPPRRAHAPP